MNYIIATLAEKIGQLDELLGLEDRCWPEFIHHSDATSWASFYTDLSDSVLVFVKKDELICAGFTVPLFWDGSIDDLPATIEEVLQRGLKAKQGGKAANTLVPIAALVDLPYRGMGLSPKILQEFRQLARRRGLKHLIVPVRPTMKSSHPFEAISSYVTWRREDGYLQDPWLRVHERLGAQIFHVADCTLTVKGTLSDWASWTNLTFPQSGNYAVPGALSPLSISVEQDIGCYREPSVWMRHII
jgi:GNAT superfamily N-acetyltransferase